jgi:hypothetical protein
LSSVFSAVVCASARLAAAWRQRAKLKWRKWRQINESVYGNM